MLPTSGLWTDRGSGGSFQSERCVRPIPCVRRRLHCPTLVRPRPGNASRPSCSMSRCSKSAWRTKPNRWCWWLRRVRAGSLPTPFGYRRRVGRHSTTALTAVPTDVRPLPATPRRFPTSDDRCGQHSDRFRGRTSPPLRLSLFRARGAVFRAAILVRGIGQFVKDHRPLEVEIAHARAVPPIAFGPGALCRRAR